MKKYALISSILAISMTSNCMEKERIQLTKKAQEIICPKDKVVLKDKEIQEFRTIFTKMIPISTRITESSHISKTELCELKKQCDSLSNQLKRLLLPKEQEQKMKRLSNNIDKVNRALYELKQVQYDPQDTFYSKIIDTKKSCNELLQDMSPIFIYESSIAYRKIEAFQQIIKNELTEDPSNELCIAIQQECQDAIDGFIYTTNKSVANFEQLSQQNS